jgi:hypothetical protein
VHELIRELRPHHESSGVLTTPCAMVGNSSTWSARTASAGSAATKPSRPADARRGLRSAPRLAGRATPRSLHRCNFSWSARNGGIRTYRISRYGTQHLGIPPTYGLSGLVWVLPIGDRRRAHPDGMDPMGPTPSGPFGHRSRPGTHRPRAPSTSAGRHNGRENCRRIRRRLSPATDSAADAAAEDHR